MPEQYLNNYLEQLRWLHPVAAIFMVLLSAVFLVFGWKHFKYLLLLDALIGGAALGGAIGHRTGLAHMDIYLGIALALVFAAIAWPLMKLAVSILGGLAGLAFGSLFWYYGAKAGGYYNLTEYFWVGGLMGMVVVGMLAFIAFQTTVIIGLGLQGALMLVSGLFALIFRVDGLGRPLSDQIGTNAFLLPLAILIPGAIGIIYQESQYLQGQAKKKKAALAKG